MRSALLCLFATLLVAPVYGQTGTGSTPPAPRGTAGHRVAARQNGRHVSAPRYKPEITLNTPIVTLDGICGETAKGSAKTAPACKTVITRAQLDGLQDAIDPDASPKARQQFALSYARLLAAGQIAEQEHLDLSPKVAKEIQVQQKLVRLQVLTNSLMEIVQMRAGIVPKRELEDYYKKYASTFEQAQVQRLAIPLNAPTLSGKPIDAAAARAKLEELRTRVLAGDDFDMLQARAYSEMEIKGEVLHTPISLMQRDGLSPEEAKVFQMDLGETSPVFEDQGVLMLFRLNFRRTLPLEEVHTQIEAVMARQRRLEELQNQTKGITAEFNLKYMESQTQPELFPPSVLTQGGMRRGMLSSLHVPQ